MDWLPVEDALETLGVQRQTLYAYVSRGLVRARADEEDPRRSLYAAGDISRLRGRRRGAKRRSEVAAGAIAWGDPVLESRISTIRDGDLIYRGQSACDLAKSATLEDTARLLWGCDEFKPWVDRIKPMREETPKRRAFAYLAFRAANEPPSLGRSAPMLQRDAASLLRNFADQLVGQNLDGPVHTRLARLWGLTSRRADLIRRALVLMADHELNASTFTVRIAASTGAPLAACALAGLSTLSGPLHGEAASRALAQLEQILAADDPAVHVRAMVARGERFAGHNHPLYPDGDVRALNLIAALKPRPKLARALRAIEQETGDHPNCDAALAAMTVELDLPSEAMFSIFALARLTGWLAHAIEQRETGQLIRPRARYVGD